MHLPHPGVPFTIQFTGGAWEWRTFDAQGGPLTGGRARSRKAAAAFVIREMCRAAAPLETLPSAYPKAA